MARSTPGPFAYLEDRVRAEIAQAREVAVTAAHHAVRAGLRIAHGKPESLTEVLGHGDWQVRFAALAGLAELSQSHSDAGWLGEVHRLAFDDPDARVRGAAWLALATASRVPQYSNAMTHLTVRAFIDRFHTRPEVRDMLERAARHWLWQLTQELDRPQRERDLEEARKKRMEALVGVDAPLIEALTPAEAKTLLDHRAPPHRIAALEALSRSGRASADHWSRVCGHVRSLPAAEAKTLMVDALERQRVASLATSKDVFELAESLRCQIEQMALGDPDARVRSAAVRAIGFLFASSGDAAIQRLLAEVAIDEARPDHTRYLACEALAMVYGLRFDERPLARIAARSAERLAAIAPFYDYQSAPLADWESGIDWSFVAQFLAE